ncbi:hypothetical protein Nmel_008998, partial [Mimus melanotis]
GVVPRGAVAPSCGKRPAPSRRAVALRSSSTESRSLPLSRLVLALSVVLLRLVGAF